MNSIVSGYPWSCCQVYCCPAVFSVELSGKWWSKCCSEHMLKNVVPIITCSLWNSGLLLLSAGTIFCSYYSVSWCNWNIYSYWAIHGNLYNNSLGHRKNNLHMGWLGFLVVPWRYIAIVKSVHLSYVERCSLSEVYLIDTLFHELLVIWQSL